LKTLLAVILIDLINRKYFIIHNETGNE